MATPRAVALLRPDLARLPARAASAASPSKGSRSTCPPARSAPPALRLLCLDPASARFELFTYTDRDDFVSASTRAITATSIPAWSLAAGPHPIAPNAWQQIAALPGVERVPKHDGRTSLRVRGIEFAELSGARPALRTERSAAPRANSMSPEIERLAEELDRARSPERRDAATRSTASIPRRGWNRRPARDIETLDASLLPRTRSTARCPLSPAASAAVLDLLAVDHTGRLTVMELKASADLHLPLQALDYWIRVKWHLDRGEFSANGYFPGIELRPDPPRLLLVSPSLEFHPATETILGYFSPAIEVERVGLGGRMAEGACKSCSAFAARAPRHRPAMLKLLKQARAAFSLLSPNEVRKRASRPSTSGWWLDGGGAMRRWRIS